MVETTDISTSVRLTVGLAVISLIGALNIDNELKVIRSDCFERLAIGHRLSGKDVYNTVDVKTVPDCQKECTNDGDDCKSFSFGIGVTGNASCDLSSKTVKETVDLQPIGTQPDPEYDLYIKKLGCKLVIEQKPETNHHEEASTSKAPGDSYVQMQYSPAYNYEALKPSKYGPEAIFRPDSTFRPSTSKFFDKYHVQTTLLSIRPDPKRPSFTGLGAGVGYSDGKQKGDYGYDDEYKPRPIYDDYRRPDHFYNDRRYGYNRPYHHPNDMYERPYRPYRPVPIDERNDYYGGPPFRPNHYNDKPPFRPTSPDYDPGPTGYSNEIPKPEFDRKKPFRDRYPYPDKLDDGDRLHLNLDRIEKYKPELTKVSTVKPAFERPEDGSSLERPSTKPLQMGYDEKPYLERPRPTYDRPEYVRPFFDYDMRPERPPPDGPLGPAYPRPPPDGPAYARPERPPPEGPAYPRPPPDGPAYPRPPPDRPGYSRPPPDGSAYPRPPPDGPAYPRPPPDGPGFSPDRPAYMRPERPPPDGPSYARPEGPTYMRPSPAYARPPLDGPPPGYARPPPDGPPSGYERPSFARPPLDEPPYMRPSYMRPPLDGYHDPPMQIDRPGPRPDPYFDRPPPEYMRPYPPPPDYDHQIDRPRPPSYDFPGPLYKGEAPQRRPADPNNPNAQEFDRPPNAGYEGNRRGDYKDETKGTKNGNATSPNQLDDSKKPQDPHDKTRPIVTHSVGPNGEQITSIITELKSTCFRRALAGKRVTSSLVKRAMPCERIEDCQQECAQERRFNCEVFNYRLDPSGRGSGDCELIGLPLVRIDMVRDVYTDRDYDVYERDRNGAPDCKGYRPPPFGVNRYPPGPGDQRRRGDYDRFEDDRRYGRPPPPPPPPQYDRRSDYYDRRPGDRDGYRDSSYNTGRDSYLPRQPSPYVPMQDRYYSDRERDRSYWGFGKGGRWGSYAGLYGNFGRPDSYLGRGANRYDHNRRNYYVPNRIGGTPDWGRYRGSYGTGGRGVPKAKGILSPYDVPAGDTYAPFDRESSFLPKYDHTYAYTPTSTGYGAVYGVTYEKPTYGVVTTAPSAGGTVGYAYPRPETPVYIDSPNHITGPGFLPTGGETVDHKLGPSVGHVGYNYLKDECSLRTATGFRLHKTIVKKYFSVTNIYECELLCFKENDFECLSYAYRYTSTSTLPTDNCYLSSKSYKDLDYYTDIEPDRDFDIYTMNNRKKCVQPLLDHEYPDCFWHTRSGQRLDLKIVRDSINVRSVVDCQLECLRSTKFLCRGFSFRFAAPVIGGPLENCLLTDWPFAEVDKSLHFVPEPGFEIYERGSFGHGCEPNHFSIRGKEPPLIGGNTDQLCYVGYGKPARLLPQAVQKSVYAASELECKAECTKTRRHDRFHCMSFSFRTKTHRGETNCDLSDILQRDLLSNVDYEPDNDAWLFAWDNYNPECISLVEAPERPRPPGGRDETIAFTYITGGYDPITALDTWRVYTVSGWPCRRGSLCKENRIAGYWYCELEGGDAGTWDYCCRPDHQCGYSAGHYYSWCYVGPQRSQWRKCSEQYYPYLHGFIDRHDEPPFRPKPFVPTYGDAPPIIIGTPTGDAFLPPLPPHRPGIRPERPPPPPPPHRPHIRRPSLAEYEQQFDSQFLDPPKPGGFAYQPRYWPVSYLHKEMPPGEQNSTKFASMKMPKEMNVNTRFAAIQNLIEIIKSNDINNIQYQIDNTTNKMDDILLVKIPLPTNFTEETKEEKRGKSLDLASSESKTEETSTEKITRTTKSVVTVTSSTSTVYSSTTAIPIPNSTSKLEAPNTQISNSTSTLISSNRIAKSLDNVSLSASRKPVPLYRKGYVTRTNVTNHGRFH